MFTTSTGRGLDYRKLGEAFRVPVPRAGSAAMGDSRSTACATANASPLIAEGLDAVFVSRQRGHADPGGTLSACAYLFARAKHALAARSAMKASYAAMTLSRS